MPRGKQVSNSVREIAVKLHQEGQSYGSIAKNLHLKRGTVQKIIEKFKRTGQFETEIRVGRPKLLKPHEERAILAKVNENPFQSARILKEAIKQDYNKEVSITTIGRTLRERGFNSRVPRKKPLLRPANIKKRLEYATKYKNAHITDQSFWENVIFTDECKFMVYGGDGRSRVWRKRNTELQRKHIKSTVKHGYQSLMVWGSMAANGVGRLYIIDGKMDSNKYIDVLKDAYLPSVTKLGLDGKSILLQDNDPKHNSRKTKEWLLYNVRNKLEHPPNHPT